ncbi:MAG: LD-carboxypeptidase [Ruminiclostridium sp.]|nr:LD-carboxypeptidase [Ruminiclostridium sp.]
MKKHIWAAPLVIALALMTGSCESKSPAPEKPAEPATTEVQLLSEGVDTECTIEYKTYSGEHSSMFLSAGDRIAVISPSALPSREQTDAVINGLKEWGYEPVEGKYVCTETRTTDEILEDLEWALKDPDIKAVFCVRGGYGASEIADILPGDLIKTSGKLIIGYSDITVYHSAWTSNDLPSVHSCMSGTFGDFPESCFEAEEKIIKGEIPVYTCKSSSYCKTGDAKGVLIGGNLSTFCSVIGAAYDCTKTDRPYILFLEDESEDIQHIHRYLTILKHAGVLDKAAGIVFGEWVDLPLSMGDYDGHSRGGEFKSVGDMISRQFLADLNIPVAFGFPAGHGDVNYPLLMGETAELSVDADNFRLDCGC